MFDKLSRSVVVPARLAFLMWAIFFLEVTWYIDLSFLGLIPRSIPGLVGIIFSPLLHGNFWHLTSNTIPLLFLGTALYFFNEKIADQVFFYCYFLTGVLVWLFGRISIHIGASGLIYGLASFLIFYGFFKKDFRSLFISAIVLLMYGGLFYGILPMQAGVSWESHLLGGIVGFFTALRYGTSKKGRRREY
jgi:membrane associated rhomboid family serine protease